MKREYRFDKYDLSAIKEWAKKHRLKCEEQDDGCVEVKLATKGGETVGYIDVCEVLTNGYFDEDVSCLAVRCLDDSFCLLTYSDWLGGVLLTMEARAAELRSKKKKERK